MAAEKVMRGGLSRKRKPVPLASELERRLTAYASAAIAAGASLAALVPLAEAEVVYTPANTVINGGLKLDLNHDGTPDFAIGTGGFTTFNYINVACAAHVTYAGPPKGIVCNYLTNQVWGRGTDRRFASALPAGVPIGPNKSYFQAAKYPFDASMGMVGCKCTTYGGSLTRGQWLSTENRYLGLQFVINGEVHYGWARLNVGFTSQGKITATLTGYAYETIPNKPILTGKTSGPDVVQFEPATLGRLAKGASQIQAWRGSNR
jgi:hypothetical protein